MNIMTDDDPPQHYEYDDEEDITNRSLIDSVVSEGTPYTGVTTDYPPPPPLEDGGKGSTIFGATLNFTNAIIGAGAMGLGGAIAISGGILSICTILTFAILAKITNDMIIALTVHVERSQWHSHSSSEHGGQREDDLPPLSLRQASGGRNKSVTYETLGEKAFGTIGLFAVLISKGLYSFGCLIAYVIVVKDNLGCGLEGAIYGSTGGSRGHHGGTPYNHTVSNHTSTSAASAVVMDVSSSSLFAADDGGAGYYYGDTTTNNNDNDDHNDDWFRRLLQNEILLTAILSTTVILPLCFVRDIAPLAKFSYLSILSMVSIAIIVIYLYFTVDNTVGVGVQALLLGGDDAEEGGWMMSDGGYSSSSSYLLGGGTAVGGGDGDGTGGFVEDWLVVRPGFFASLGTFVFTFVAQHTVHITYESLQPQYRNLHSWKRVSLYSITTSTIVSLTIGIFVYLTFGLATQSDMFEIYTPSPGVDVARILLSVSMLLTFPLPFFTCREMIIVMLSKCELRKRRERRRRDRMVSAQQLGLTEGFLSPTDDDPADLTFNTSTSGRYFGGEKDNESFTGTTYSEYLSPEEEQLGLISPSSSSSRGQHRSWLIPGKDRQLRTKYHILITTIIWFITTILALVAPSLGSVLDVVGCISGTVIAFLLPGLFAWKLRGYSHLSLGVVIVGIVVGVVGTIFSIKKLIEDMMI